MSAPNQLSFLPEDYLETKRQRRTNVICTVLFVLIMTGIVATRLVIEKSLHLAETENADVCKQSAEAATRIEQDRQLQEKQLKMNNQAELTASLLEKVPRSVLLAELTNAKPLGVSFLDLTLDSKLKQGGAQAQAGKTQFEMKRAAAEETKGAKPAPQAKVYDVTVKVTGICDNDVQVSQFIANLNHSKLVKDVNLLISDEFAVGTLKMRKFQLEMMIDPAADVQPGVLPRGTTAAVELK
jgi:Tfp pilus assembly protein PilN